MRGQTHASADDIVLTPRERERLHQELAQIFRTDAAAEKVLSRIGFERERRLNLDTVPAGEGWAAIMKEFDHGAVHAPYRSIITAVLAEYPFNQLCHDLARRYGVEAPERDGPVFD
jgi:hypothetical protein